MGRFDVRSILGSAAGVVGLAFSAARAVGDPVRRVIAAGATKIAEVAAPKPRSADEPGPAADESAIEEPAPESTLEPAPEPAPEPPVTEDSEPRPAVATEPSVAMHGGPRGQALPDEEADLGVHESLDEEDLDVLTAAGTTGVAPGVNPATGLPHTVVSDEALLDAAAAKALRAETEMLTEAAKSERE